MTFSTEQVEALKAQYVGLEDHWDAFLWWATHNINPKGAEMKRISDGKLRYDWRKSAIGNRWAAVAIPVRKK